MAGGPPNFNQLSTFDFGRIPGQINREDVIDLLTNVDYKNTPFFNSIPKVTADAPTHEWTEYQVKDPKLAIDAVNENTSLVAGVIEGADFLASVFNIPRRNVNFCQIFSRHIQVSRSQMKANPIGIGDMFAHHTRVAMTELTRAIEARMFSTLFATGNNGTATEGTIRLMKTLEGFIGGSNQISIGADAAPAQLTETNVLNLLRLIAENGGMTTDIYCSLPVKQFISKNFTGVGVVTGNANAPLMRTVEAADRTVWSTFDVYYTDFGQARLTGSLWVTKQLETMVDSGGTSRNQTATPANGGYGGGGVALPFSLVSGGSPGNYLGPTATNAAGRLWALQRGLVRWAWFDPLHPGPIGPRGDSVSGIVVGEGTIEVLGEKAHGVIRNIADPTGF